MMLTSEPVHVSTTVSLRQASFRDGHRIWQWNNAPEVRAVARQRQPISIDEHQRWYADRLCEPGHYMWVAVVDGDDAGVIRIDARAPATRAAMVSIALDQTMRSRGVGRRVLRVACRRIGAIRPALRLQAWIDATNSASARCFEHADFVWMRAETVDDRTFNIYHWEPR